MMANNLVPQDVLRAPTWYENALLNAIMPYSKQTPAANALINATTNAQSSLAYPALQYAKGNKVSYKDIWNALTGNNTADWVDVMKEVLPKAQRKMPENVYVNPKMAGAMGTALNMLLDPTNFVPVGIAGEIKNVYHGSPYLFDKFSLSKIGTGEGAQAFGYGHYLTSDKNIARHYSGTDKAYKIDGLTVREWYDKHPLRGINNVIDAAKHLNTDVVSARKWMDSNQDLVELRVADAINTYGDNAEYMLRSHKDYDAIKKLDEMRAENRVQESGHIYEATIAKGRPHTMLQWDKPVTKAQWNKIRSQAIKEGIDDIDAIMGKVFDEPGSYVYYNLSDAITRKLNAKAGGDVFRDDPKLASEFLKRAGIDGIEYPSGTLSGIKDSPHKNYVVFDDADITIEKRTPR